MRGVFLATMAIFANADACALEPDRPAWFLRGFIL